MGEVDSSGRTLTKIVLVTPAELMGKGESDLTEAVWAEPLGGDRYVVKNEPITPLLGLDFTVTAPFEKGIPMWRPTNRAGGLKFGQRREVTLGYTDTAGETHYVNMNGTVADVETKPQGLRVQLGALAVDVETKPETLRDLVYGLATDMFGAAVKEPTEAAE